MPRVSALSRVGASSAARRVLPSKQFSAQVHIRLSRPTSCPRCVGRLSASVVMTRRVHAEPSPLVFSYHAMVASLTEAERASMSPSPSTSIGLTRTDKWN